GLGVRARVQCAARPVGGPVDRLAHAPGPSAAPARHRGHPGRRGLRKHGAQAGAGPAPGRRDRLVVLAPVAPHSRASGPRLPGTLVPLAGFRLSARVLSREDYSTGREARFSPTDLALGWGPMGEDAVLSRLRIRQSARWYHYRWSGDPPIPRREIARNSANMH